MKYIFYDIYYDALDIYIIHGVQIIFLWHLYIIKDC